MWLEPVHLAGAFDGECIEDMEIALGHLDVDFTRLEEFIVGGPFSMGAVQCLKPRTG